MRYLEGQTLTGFLKSRNAPIEQGLIVHIVGEVLNGLQAAHDRRIIHRDLKPDNLYITALKDDPYRTIILDFGVAQLGHEAGVITRTGAMIGTPQYMAPEQHRSMPIDHRADIWAMGAIVYEMATGRLPYQVDDAERGFLTGPEIYHRMMTRPVVDLRQYNPAITEAFARATLTALALDPAGRPDSARALALMLAEGTPGNRLAPSGIEVLKTHADELLEGDAPGQTVPSPALPGSGRQRRVAAEIAVPSAPMSTLGATTGQSFPGVQPPGASRARRSLIAVGLGVVAAAVTSLVLLSRHDAPSVAKPQDQVSAPRNDATIASVPAYDYADVVALARSNAAMLDAATPDVATPAAARSNAAMLDAATLDAATPDVATPAAATPTATTPAAATTDVATPAAATPDVATPDVVTPDAAKLGGYPRDAAVPDTPAPAQAARAAPAATGKLKVVILPWAEVWVDGRAHGQTPVLTKLSVGPHRVRLKNDVREKTVTVTVTSAKTAVIDETW
jgi:serine/threonine-protein kinase